MKEMDLASISASCQFAFFFTPVENETITTHVWRDQVVFSMFVGRIVLCTTIFSKITESVQQQGVEVINTAAMTTSMFEEEVMLRTKEHCVSQGDMRLHIRNQQA